ncbi:MAG: GrpB family protein [Minisyncoccia bacterium]|jgi:GrpB-like predicted nucleotidyltransferase (UPF0157 family)
MITPGQEKYLATLPNGRIAHVKPFDPLARETGLALVAEIKKALPEVAIYYIGSSVLGIAGENDIDISIISAGLFGTELSALESLYDKPTSYKPDKKRAEWKFERNNFPVELYFKGEMTPLFAEQLKTHEILKRSPVLAKEYEQIKLAAGGLNWKDYMRRKYEFFNRISGAN